MTADLTAGTRPALAEPGPAPRAGVATAVLDRLTSWAGPVIIAVAGVSVTVVLPLGLLR